jgi:molybdopterin converting factor small subunit
MRIYYLAGVILSITTVLSACGGGEPTECTISTPREIRQGVTKTGKFAPGTDCEAMRKLAEEGKPLPTIAEGTTTNTAPKAAATPLQEGFKTPFVAGQKTQELIATTDKQARVQELEKKIGVDSKQSRDPFTSAIINPVPKLETLLAKPKEQPNLRPAVVVRTSNIKVLAPPDTKLAEGAKVTGTVEVSGTVYAIISAAEEPSARYVKAGQLISNGKVLVKRIDTNAEPPIVVLQQNGVEILRPVGARIVAEKNNTQTANPPTPQSTPSFTIPPLTPAR